MIERPHAVLGIPGIRNHYSNGMIIDSYYTAVSGFMDLSERLMILVNRKVHHWWSVYQGLQRSSAIGAVLPIKPLPFGEPEYSLDLVWIIKMDLQGEFVTSKQIDLVKYYRNESVSAQWGKGIIIWMALWVSIVSELRNSSLPKSEKKKLQESMLRLVGDKIRHRIPLFKKVS